MADTDLHDQSIATLSRRIHGGELSPVELTEHLLTRIERLDPKLHAFHRVLRERALAEARAAETTLRAGASRGPLHGIPYALKDLADVQGVPTAAGSPLWEDRVAGADSTLVRRLSAAGMILLGKTHLVQFAYGGVGINHQHGTPHNPWDAAHRVPGGSSSGSGVAVAAGLAPMAIGTDTGGSVRIPAALNGTAGLKTTVGRVSTHGIVPLSWSLDSVGPLTRTVADAALTYAAMQGPDPADSATLTAPPAVDPLAGLKRGARGLRMAFAETTFWDDVDPEVTRAVRATGEVFRDLGADVFDIPFPEAEEARRLNPRGLIIAAEAYCYHQELLASAAHELDPIVGERLLLGRDIPAWEYVGTTREWNRLRARVSETLADIDCLIVPATQLPARPLAEVDQGFERYQEYNLAYLRNCSIGNILNLCGLALPCGFTGEGLPIGLMLYAKPWAEHVALRAGWAYEQATDWHRRRPDLGWAGA